MKKFLCVAILAIACVMTGCKDYDSDIADIHNRIDGIEKSQIASLKQQIEAINKSIPELEKTSKELKGYIESLQKSAANLQKSIDETNSKINQVEEAMEDEIESVRANVLAQLNATKAELESELEQLNSTIASLQAKDAELEQKIASLQSYVDNELANTKDWAEATFATIAQYNSLTSDVSTIKSNIESLNASLEALERKLEEGLSEEIAKAMEPVKDELATELVLDITTSYTNAISDAKSEITAAYTAAISAAINNLEASMRLWVNERLTGYYTIAQTDAKLKMLQNEFTSQLQNQKAYLEDLINSLSVELKGKIDANAMLIDALQQDILQMEEVDAQHTSAIAQNAYDISQNAVKINQATQQITANAMQIDALQNQIKMLESQMQNKISEIEQSLTKLNADIDTINQQIALVRDEFQQQIAALKDQITILINNNSQLINSNTMAIDQNSQKIAENKQSILALEQSTSEAILHNTMLIDKNAQDIAKNASLISANATAINNNANAIAQNTEKIIQLQQDLITAKTEITAAYKTAIKTAIETLDGELRDEIATQVALINDRIDNEVETINETITAITKRVEQLEKEVKNIKVAIYNIQTEIAAMQEQIAALIERIQSVSFVPEYSDGKATMYYTNSSGIITPGSATLKYEIRPADVAEQIADVWEDALSVKAVYTQTRATVGEFVDLTIESVSATDGILNIKVSGAALDEEFFRSEISANVRMEISNGYNHFATDYVNMVPWTTNTVYVADANFKAYLLGEYDTNGDNEISLDEAELITEINIAASLLQVKSLAGIEYFTNLEKLDCSFNRIETLDLSNNTKLSEVNVSNNRLTSLTIPASVKTLDASVNRLTTIDVSEATALTELNVAGNSIASLNVSQNKALTELNVSDNKLVRIDVTKLLSLVEFACGGNQLSELNVTKNTLLASLDCKGNSLTMLDLTKNTALASLDCSENDLTAIYLGTEKLTELDCSDNALTSLNLSQQTKLKTLDCSKNALTQLDVTKCTKLENMDCSFNSLTSLNVSCNPALATLDCSNNPELAKLWVKDNAQADAVAINKEDATELYYNNGGLNIPDAKLKSYLVNNYDDDGDGEISIAESDNITMVNVSGKGISDLTGLEACTNLVTLNCSNNNITKIELPNLAKFTTLTCYGNPISKIDLTNCVVLNKFNIINLETNAVRDTEIWINGYAGATTMDITLLGTPFTTFTFTNATALTKIEFYGDFTTVNLYGNSALESIDVNPIRDLQTLDVHACHLTSLDVTAKEKLTWLDASANALTEMNVTQNNLLEHLNLADNGLSVINVRNNTALTYFNINNNTAIDTVNVTKNTALTELYVNNMAITELNVSNNTLLTHIECNTNPNMTTLIAYDTFDFITTFVSFDKTTKLLNTQGEAFVPEVGDYMEVNLGKGVVFSVDAPTGSYKIVSCGEVQAEWSTKEVETGAIDDDNGAYNMEIIKSQPDWETNYPAFKWCADYGKDWYLPARNELYTIYEQKSIIDSTLSANGYTSLKRDYWSSTESSGSYAYYGPKINSFTDDKNDVHWFRAVLTIN